MNRDMQDYSPPPAEFANLPPELTPPGPEFTPEGAAQPEAEKPRRRKLRFLLYAAAALVYLGLLFRPGGEKTPLPEPVPPVPAPVASAQPEPTPEPTPEPVGSEPVIRTEFFSFSHEHHGRVYLSNTDALRSVEVSVRDKTLDLVAYDYFLSEEEIASGLYELPMLSTGDVFMEHMDEYDAVGGWPEFEMSVDARYEGSDGSEAAILETTEPAFELGVGLSYWPPDYTWDEQLPPDSFRVVPWEEIEELRYVINDPTAVTDPLTVSVDLSYEGRHAAPEEYETILYREEYELYNAETGGYEPTVGYTRQLLLRRPDWMPEQGTVHVVIVQRLASTGELWTREFDLSYPD